VKIGWLGRSGLLLLAAAALSGPAVPAAFAAPVPGRPNGGTAVRQFGGCLAARKTGALLLLIDQSGSLQTTDPAGVRATAASYLLDQLSATSRATGIDLDVAIAGFDVGYEQVVGWTRLTPQALPRLRRSVDDFRGRNSGLDTDYVAAIDGVRRSFRDRDTADTDGCQAAVWFTDGKFDLEPRDTQERRRRYGTTKQYAPGVQVVDRAGVDRATAAGRAAICRSGGAADQLRAAGVLTLAEGLGSPSSTDFAFLRAVATGRDGSGGVCGRATTSTIGDFGLAANIDDLLFAFDAIGDPGQPPALADSGVCALRVCAAQTRSFVLDRSIRAVHVLAAADADGIQLVLRAPDGSRTVLRNDGGAPSSPPATLGGGRLTARWLSKRTVDLSLNRNDAKRWTGRWSLTFVDPSPPIGGARGRTQIRITGDLIPSVTSPDPLQLRTGGTAMLRLGLSSEADGRPVAASTVPGDATQTVELHAAGGWTSTLAAPVTKSELDHEVALDLAGAPVGPATLRLILAARTAAVPATSGEAADHVVDLAVDILPPLNFPRVSGRLDFGGQEGVGPFEASLTVTGPGCVWVDGGAITASPDGVGTVGVAAATATDAASCLPVSTEQTASLPIRLTLQRPGTGSVAGTVTAHLAPNGAPDRAVDTQVSWIADVTKPPAESVRLSVLAVALLIGLGGPLLFLYVAKWWTARIPGVPLLCGIVRASVRDGAVFRDGRPFSVTHDDVAYVAVHGSGARRLALPQGVTLVTKTGARPTSPGYVLLTAPGRAAVGGPNVRSGRGPVGRMPLTVHNTWVALVGGVEDGVEVLLLMTAGGDGDRYAQATEQIRAGLPRLVDQALARRNAATQPQERPRSREARDTNSDPSTGWFTGPDTGGPAPGDASAPRAAARRPPSEEPASGGADGPRPSPGRAARADPGGARSGPAAGDDWWGTP
jgi:hypothetical protein